MLEPIKNYDGITATINITEDCNLRCKYCYETEKRPRTIDLDVARKYVDLILSEELDKLKTDKNINLFNTGLILDFIGGDALINPQLIDNIIEYFQYRAWKIKHHWRNRWRISISTNGTLFEREDVKRFMEKYIHNLSIGVSIDGCPELHDRNRVFKDGSGTFNTIKKQWEYYKNWCMRAGIELSTKATLNKESVGYITKSVKYLKEELGLRHINMNFIMEKQDWDTETLEKLDRDLSELAEYVLKNDDVYVSLLDKHVSCGMPIDEPRSRCGSGIMPALSIDGKVYGCFRYLPVCTSYDMPIGNVDDGLIYIDNIKKIQEATNVSISSEKCIKCQIESMCPYCLAGCLRNDGEFRRTTYICDVAKLQDKWAKYYWREYDKKHGTKTEEAYYDTWEEYCGKQYKD